MHEKAKHRLEGLQRQATGETTEGYAYDMDGVTLVVHPAHIFSRCAGVGDGLKTNKPKGLWQVSELETGTTLTGDGVTFANQKEAIEAAQKRIDAHGGYAGARRAVAATLKRYAEMLV